MKFCPVVPEICCGQVHASRKERIRIIIIIIIIIIIKIKIIIRNGANTISLQTLFGRLNNNNKYYHNYNITLNIHNFPVSTEYSVFLCRKLRSSNF